MKGPLRLLRSGKISGMERLGTIYEWFESSIYLVIEEVSFQGKKGAILCYYNPPVHQVGNPALDAYLEGLDRVYGRKEDLQFFMMVSANDPVHAGGDLKESLEKLDKTLAMKKEKERAGASTEEIDELYTWADSRLKKGVALHGKMRKLAQHLRTVAVCGGGTRFGGSAEIPLMSDYIVGDSRSGMCFSEAMIGLLPGWSGVARAIVKAGPRNARAMAMTGKEVKADKLKAIGIYNVVVDISLPFPRMQRAGDPKADKASYAEALEKHDEETGMILIPGALEIATGDETRIPLVEEPAALALEAEISEEVERRKDPEKYAHLWGKPLKEVGDEIGKLGRPLAPQSVEALSALIGSYDRSGFDEQDFVQKEAEADARLYRDPRFRAGLKATLEQKVANYKEAS
ncbi:MAG: enoyl-CoA hydratase/isomerase family protein [Deltaproteobacteria bacterium]|nr:enoyl-CoA hydratase/isomerase family protein [Deltaproteobacteria bacterium]